MKILHLCLSSPYTDGWSYQENLLSKQQVSEGHNVFLITTTKAHNNDGSLFEVGASQYTDNNGVIIIRLNRKKGVFSKFNRVFDNYEILPILIKINPDLIMVHGLGSISQLTLIKYKEKFNKKVILIADTHADYYNTLISKNIKAKIYIKIIRKINCKMQKFYRSIYAMSKYCKDFAIEYYGIKKELISYLPLAADDAYIKKVKSEIDVNDIYNKYDISRKSFLIVTGGKIKFDKNLDLLIDSLSNFSKEDISLVVFGEFADNEYRSLIMNKKRTLKNGVKVIFTGHLNVFDIYSLFYISDLAIFPGSQSALWQQAIAMECPLIVKYWPGVEMLNSNGNITYIQNINSDLLYEKIKNFMYDQSLRDRAKKAAKEISHKFLYSYVSSVIIENKEW